MEAGCLSETPEQTKTTKIAKTLSAVGHLGRGSLGFSQDRPASIERPSPAVGHLGEDCTRGWPSWGRLHARLAFLGALRPPFGISRHAGFAWAGFACPPSIRQTHFPSEQAARPRYLGIGLLWPAVGQNFARGIFGERRVRYTTRLAWGRLAWEVVFWVFGGSAALIPPGILQKGG